MKRDRKRGKGWRGGEDAKRGMLPRRRHPV